MSEYFKVNTKIIDNYGPYLPAPTIQTYIGLLRHADSRGVVADHKTQAGWARIIGVGGTTFKKSIAILKELHLLDVLHPKNPIECCAYVVLDPDKAKPPKKYTIQKMNQNRKSQHALT